MHGCASWATSQEELEEDAEAGFSTDQLKLTHWVV